MWTFPINPQNTSSTTTNNDSSSPSSITIAEEVEPSACERECVEQQRTLVACVDSIRAARLQSQQQQADETQADDGGGGATTTSTDTPECLPMAVAAWTKCCEEANLREREMKKKDEEKG